ncbi:MAG: TetR/AcrR family transcriptional regulator [Pseudomonadota bacterium]
MLVRKRATGRSNTIEGERDGCDGVPFPESAAREAPPSAGPGSGLDLRGVDVPPGGIKLMHALHQLLEKKGFDAISTAEISRVAGVNEALIYRYFGDKRGLLHRILEEYTREHLNEIKRAVEDVDGALDKLRNLMKGNIAFHKRNRVFSRILLLEVRSFPGYFESDAYKLVKDYAGLIDEIVSEGVANKEIREDVSPACVKDLIVGSIEHACLRSVVFHWEFDVEVLARNLSDAVIRGLGGAEPAPLPVKGKQRPEDNRGMRKKTAKGRPGKTV